MSRQDRIRELEEELKKTKYNKRTQHHIGLVKAKIARLKEEIEQKKKGKGKTTGYVLKKSGDATAVLVGFPSVGKSTLLNAITNAESKVAAYEFTTLNVIPGMLRHKHAKIQIFDVPGIVKGASKGTGRGKEVLAAIRTADLIIVVIDINQIKHKEILEKELYDSGIRLNKEKPEIKKETIRAILNELGIINADIVIRSKINVDELIDSIEGNKSYIPGLFVFNKIDSAPEEYVKEIKKKYPEAMFISAKQGINLNELKEKIHSLIGLIRIYLKEPGNQPDMEEPLILKKNSTLKDLCNKLHRDFVKRFRFARIWGSTKYSGQKIVNLNYVLKDKDIVELHIK